MLNSRFLILLFCVSNFYNTGAQTFSSSTPISVATDLGFNHPQLEIASDGLPLVLWTDQSTYNIYIAKHNGIDAFNTPTQLNPTGFDVQSFNWSGPDLAVENDNVYVVFRSYGYDTGNIYCVKSSDNGSTFGDTVRVDNLASGYGQYPDIAVLNDTVWVTFMDHDASGMNPQYVVSRSIDGGLTFETEVAAGAILGAEACDCCQPEIIVNDDYVIVFMRNNDSNIRDIKGIISYDRGATFTDFISVDDHLWNIMSCPSTGPDARFLNDQTILATYKTEVGGEGQVFINEYDINSDMSLGLVQLLATGESNSVVNYPQIASEDGVLGIVWEGLSNGLDVFINSSSTGVAGLNPDNAMNITDAVSTQSKPDIAIAGGKFHVVYTDNPNNDIKYLTLQSLTGIESRQIDLNIYPNPSSDYLVININTPFNEGKMEFYNTLGKLVYSNRIQSPASTFNTSELDPGSYILRITVDGKRINKRISIL